MSEAIDISDICASKTDQLNAVDFGDRTMTVKIKGIKVKKGEEQPMTIHLHDSLPFRPCLTMRRLMKELWGKDAAVWIGRSMTLYNDPKVSFGKVQTGGIRISHMTDIGGRRTVTLPVSRGKFESFVVEPLRVQSQQKPDRPTADLAQVLADAELTTADLDRWLASKGKPGSASQSAEKQSELGGYLVGHPDALAEIRAMVPTDPDPDAVVEVEI